MMNPNALLPINPLDDRTQPPRRIDVQRALLRHQRQYYQAQQQDLAREAGRQRPAPLFVARQALGRALIAIGRQMATDTGGGSNPTSHGLRAIQKAC